MSTWNLPLANLLNSQQSSLQHVYPMTFLEQKQQGRRFLHNININNVCIVNSLDNVWRKTCWICFFSSDIKIRTQILWIYPLPSYSFKWMCTGILWVSVVRSMLHVSSRDPSVVSRLKLKVLALSNLEVVGQIRTPIEYLVELLRTEVGWFPPGVPPRRMPWFCPPKKS